MCRPGDSEFEELFWRDRAIAPSEWCPFAAEPQAGLQTGCERLLYGSVLAWGKLWVIDPTS